MTLLSVVKIYITQLIDIVIVFVRITMMKIIIMVAKTVILMVKSFQTILSDI